MTGSSRTVDLSSLSESKKLFRIHGTAFLVCEHQLRGLYELSGLSIVDEPLILGAFVSGAYDEQQ